MTYRYVISHSHNPYYNLAYELALFDCVGQDSAVLFLWQNKHTIVIGKNQVIENEIKVDQFIENGGTIARRLSGGGTVYHDLGNLCFSIIAKKDTDVINYHDLVIKTLSRFDIEASYNGRNDVMIDNKKISGNAFYDNGDVYCQHGTILIDVNEDNLAFLTPEESKLTRNGVPSVFSRVINLKTIIPSINTNIVKREMIKELKATKLNKKINKRKIIDLQKRFSSRKWIIERVFE